MTNVLVWDLHFLDENRLPVMVPVHGPFYVSRWRIEYHIFDSQAAALTYAALYPHRKYVLHNRSWNSSYMNIPGIVDHRNKEIAA